MKSSLKNPLMRASAAITTFMISASAHAQVGFGGGGSKNLIGVVTSASDNVYEVTTLISTGSYVCGTAFAMGGLLNLKKSAEEPGRESMGKGVGKIAVGAALVTLPTILSIAINSMGINPNQGVGVTGSDTNRLYQ